MKPDLYRMAGCALMTLSAAVFAGALLIVVWAITPSVVRP